ncbi:DoxX family protein [Ovoidimarina sediminis]|uniref:DoxX family protein n=1 Tax=Ovoidimarina sediminis TaxID=3079856 RepID=UPI0029158BA1|nr:DoxX family protein [Rhodophyticola sp. MJ-SS7]MDU8941973.1 DoxX family protein [Rhodophyticola sp. MJ-SS7]
MTNSLNDTALLVARILLGALFVMAGIGKLGDVAGFAGYMASGGVPAFLAWPVIAFEIIGGLALIVGLQTRVAALALGAFSLVSGAMYHFVPADQMQMTMFLKNLALTGGYVAMAVAGAGRFSVDAWTGGKTAAA